MNATAGSSSPSRYSPSAKLLSHGPKLLWDQCTLIQDGDTRVCLCKHHLYLLAKNRNEHRPIFRDILRTQKYLVQKRSYQVKGALEERPVQMHIIQNICLTCKGPRKIPSKALLRRFKCNHDLFSDTQREEKQEQKWHMIINLIPYLSQKHPTAPLQYPATLGGACESESMQRSMGWHAESQYHHPSAS